MSRWISPTLLSSASRSENRSWICLHSIGISPFTGRPAAATSAPFPDSGWCSPIRQAACKQVGDSPGVHAEADLDVRSPSPTPVKICHRRHGSEFAARFDIYGKVAGCEQVRLDAVGNADHTVILDAAAPEGLDTAPPR